MGKEKKKKRREEHFETSCSFLQWTSQKEPDDFLVWCYENPEEAISSFSSKSVDERNEDFYFSQKKEEEELNFWLDEIERLKG